MTRGEDVANKVDITSTSNETDAHTHYANDETAISGVAKIEHEIVIKCEFKLN